MAFKLTLRSKDGTLPSFQELEAEAREYGVLFSLSGNQGTFPGRGVEGTWERHEDRFELTVTDKPFLLPESLIKGAVKKWFASIQ